MLCRVCVGRQVSEHSVHCSLLPPADGVNVVAGQWIPGSALSQKIINDYLSELSDCLLESGTAGVWKDFL